MKLFSTPKIAVAFLTGFLAIAVNGFGQKSYPYDSAPNDPLHARIYHLDNGLTVYLSVYKNAPRIQTYIATRAGSKNDPSDATGLAHYLEHMLFKGTDKYGTKDYAKEKVELDKIEALYEQYRKIKDPAQRKMVYHQIDSISGYASQFAIANEYDKMLSSIGAKGTNAYTWLEQTVYVNDIPSNQLEKWMTIESERYRNPVMRLFHTELEAVYEEKNRSLDNDGDKSWDALFSGLWPTNTYGSQTTIGTIDHLKNPSLTAIKKYFNTYYVPNNMAICLSGDLDPDETIRMIDAKFSGWKSKPVPDYKPYQEPPILSPVVKDVVGPDAENLLLGYRFPGINTSDADMMLLVSKILSNGKAGLIDLDLKQQQQVLDADASELRLRDYSTLILSGVPKEGQSLDQVKSLLLAEIEKLKKGEFPDWLLSAIITDMKFQQTKMYESNSNRADAFVTAFIEHIDWKDYVSTIDRLSHYTKQDIVNFARKNMGNNYVLINKHIGEDTTIQKVDKPEITPVQVNRNDQSDFVKTIMSTKVKEIEPVFLDYSKDIQTTETSNHIPVLYRQNTENNTFSLYYVLDMGTNNDKRIGIAVDYLKFLGTKNKSAADISEEFYKLGCNFNVYSGDEEVWVSLNGLSENMEKGLQLFEDLLTHAEPNPEALKSLVDDELKKRADAKLDKSTVLFAALYSYGKYGASSPFTNILSEQELKNLKPEELVTLLHQLTSFQHRILFYGSQTAGDVTKLLSDYHKTPEKLLPVPAEKSFPEKDTPPQVFVVDRDMKQAEIILLSKDENYNKENVPTAKLYNEYFGGSMSSLVFQEIRESKALAYSVFSSYSFAPKLNRCNYAFSYIGTQADKLPEAMKSMQELITDMPLAEGNFKLAQEAIIQSIRTERITKQNILFNYEDAKRLGLTEDIRRSIFTQVPKITMEQIKKFQEAHIKNKTATILVMGKKESLDLETLKKYGEVHFLSLEDIFGY